MNDQDRRYYERRARQERIMADGCSDGSIGLIHLKLAEAYERRLRQVSQVRALSNIPVRA